LFLHRHRERFAANHRMSQMVRNLDRLADLDQLLAENPTGLPRE
jgi:deoxyribodipyrimidine photolyase-related protein